MRSDQVGQKGKGGAASYFPDSQGWSITGIGHYGVKNVHMGSNNVF